jgi:hypothetical protein
MIKNHIIDITLSFIEQYFQDTDGVLLFGSAIRSDIYEDIDLLILYDKFSYFSKETIPYKNSSFSIIKVPSHEIFNLLADDFKDGIYRNIIDSGIILKDSYNTLKVLKQYILNKYPDNYMVIRYSFNKLIPEINKSLKVFSKDKSFLEEYSLFNKIISLLADFQLLKDGKINFTKSEKQKYRYLFENHPFFYLELQNLVINYNTNSKKRSIIKLNIIVEKLTIPQSDHFTNDFQSDYIDFTRIVFFIKTYKRFPQIKELIRMLFVTFPKESFYSYYTDENNIEESGIYIVFKNLTDKLLAVRIKNIISEYFDKSTAIYFPYNELFYHPEIKFHGKENLSIIESVLIEFQSELFHSNFSISEIIIPMINYLLMTLEIDVRKMKDFYFCKTLNNSHQYNYNEVQKITANEYFNYEALISSMFKNKEFIAIKNIYSIDTISLSKLKNIPKYFLLQFIDRFLSLHFLKDEEKKFYIFCSYKIQ